MNIFAVHKANESADGGIIRNACVGAAVFNRNVCAFDTDALNFGIRAYYGEESCAPGYRLGLVGGIVGYGSVDVKAKDLMTLTVELTLTAYALLGYGLDPLFGIGGLCPVYVGSVVKINIICEKEEFTLGLGVGNELFKLCRGFDHKGIAARTAARCVGVGDRSVPDIACGKERKSCEGRKEDRKCENYRDR